MKMLNNIEVVPSLPATNLGELQTLLQSLRHITRGFQIDLVDGLFVKTTPSWPYNTGGDIPEELKKLLPTINDFAIGFDCMIKNPTALFEVFKELSAERVVLHFGSSTNIESDIQYAKQCGFIVALGVLNDTPFTDYEHLLAKVDAVQVMGIKKIGVQGQPFDTRTIKTVEMIKSSFPDLTIAVDGSVNKHTIPALVKVGVSRLAPGSAIAKQPDPAAAYCELLTLATSQQLVRT